MSKLGEVPFIEGKRVNLQPLNSEHIKFYIKWENNENVRRYSRNLLPFTVEDLKKAIESEAKAGVKGNIHLEIYHKNDDKIIGFAEFNEINWGSRRADLGLLIGEPEYWGQGLATEIGNLMINYAFNELNLNKITASVFPQNTASWKFMEKIGMKREAVFKNHEYVDGEYLDLYHYCIFKEEWKKGNINE